MKKERYLNLHGANCASCAFAIEKFGRRLEGVADIQVDGLNSQVKVDFDIEEEERQNSTLKSIVDLVRRIGYDADIRG
ncbi:MAG: cation transporter [Sediminispirochaetaceae bacterium]